jgi:diguanylate cyclase (GGDEF)-like protein/PAS domain S-box-containing protein
MLSQTPRVLLPSAVYSPFVACQWVAKQGIDLYDSPLEARAPHEVKREMQGSPHLLRVALQSVRDAVVTTDAAARVQWLNQAAETLTGWTSEDAIGHPVERVVNLREDDNAVANPVHAALLAGQRVTAEGSAPGRVHLVDKAGNRVPVRVAAAPASDAEGAAQSCILIFHSLIETIELAEQLAYRSQHDPLTGLPNRILLIDRIEQGARLADRYMELMAVMFVDLDLFGAFRATHGQASADDLLRSVASRLTGALRESDTVCRLGRDEFVVMLTGVKTMAQIEAVAHKLLDRVARPIRIGESDVHTSCCIGVSVYPDDASDSGTLVRLADQAMLQARQLGRSRYAFANAGHEHSTSAGGIASLSIGNESR